MRFVTWVPCVRVTLEEIAEAMNSRKRYLVFVSSTYTDLVDERQAVSQALLRSNCFPSQMENWPAMDAEQMVAIKQLIDECDYYLVVSAGKYGSVEPVSGMSYTELEYDYAQSIGKPTIRLLHRDPFKALRGDQIETDLAARASLKRFRSKLKRSSVCSFWTTPEELKTETILALQDLTERHPVEGWVRSDTVAGARDQQREFELMNQLIDNLRKQDLDLGSALRDLPVPMIRMSEQGVIKAFNEAARDLIGDQLNVGIQFGSLFEALGRPIEGWLREGLLGSGSSVTENLRLQESDKDTLIQAKISAIEGRLGNGFIAVLDDATQLKSLERQLIQSQKMEVISQLAGGVARDFNDLLTAISGHCDLLMLRRDPGDPDFGDLEQINHNTNRAASLVGQLLAFSRKQNLQFAAIDLRDLILDLSHLLNRLAGDEVSIETSFDDELPLIRADKRQIKQVIMNIVVNARDAMEGIGTIKVDCVALNLTKDFIRQNTVIPNGKYAQISISDHGVGIAPEYIGRIFEPFFTTKWNRKGAGIRLSTAYGIVKQSGGFLFVKSRLKEGTVFEMLFPEDELQEQIPADLVNQYPYEAELPEGTETVLLAEDEAAVRTFMSRCLQLRGYYVLEASGGEEALELLREAEGQVDLIISNVTMPGLDGPTWVKEALKLVPETPVIFVSGYLEDDYFGNGPLLPGSVFLPKPFSVRQLVTAVHHELTTRRSVD